MIFTSSSHVWDNGGAEVSWEQPWIEAWLNPAITTEEMCGTTLWRFLQFPPQSSDPPWRFQRRRETVRHQPTRLFQRFTTNRSMWVINKALFLDWPIYLENIKPTYNTFRCPHHLMKSLASNTWHIKHLLYLWMWKKPHLQLILRLWRKLKWCPVGKQVTAADTDSQL